MVFQASFDAPAPRRAKEWSPIDRMLANKRGSGSRRNSPARAPAPPELPPLPPQAPQQPSIRTASAACQTVSWSALTAEVLAPEKARTQALQAELKALRAQMKEREGAAIAADAAAASDAEARSALVAELEAARQLLSQERADREEERRAWLEEQQRLQDQVAAAGGVEKRRAEDLEHLRAELMRSKDDAAVLRKKFGPLQQEVEALTRERDSLSKEKDHLLQRLEVEQAEMMARVEVLQRKMDERPSKGR